LRLLHLIDTVDAASGGPAEGVRRSSRSLRLLGHDVEVLSLDAPGAGAGADLPVPWHALGPVTGSYRYTPSLVPWLRERGPRYDAVVVHGLWQYVGLAARTALRPAGVPYLVYTHGMLDPWFKRTYPLKHAKKWLYWPWGEYRVLRDAAAVLFTCEEERRLARESFWLYRARERVVSFGAAEPPGDTAALADAFRQRHGVAPDRRLLLFLGRLHEKKGCDLLVDAFARVARQDERLVLVMAGPDPSGWQASLQARARAAGVGERVVWTGMLAGDAKWGALGACEALVLPSHQENFGIVVAEALACARPVLVSDKVNIWREVEADKAGLVAPDDAAGTEHLLREWLGLTPEARAAMGSAARSCFERRFTALAMSRSLLEAAEEVVGRPAALRPNVGRPSA
jgi:glycosyltransferase involved in cell wall biosynthesis